MCNFWRRTIVPEKNHDEPNYTKFLVGIHMLCMGALPTPHPSPKLRLKRLINLFWPSSPSQKQNINKQTFKYCVWAYEKCILFAYSLRPKAQSSNAAVQSQAIAGLNKCQTHTTYSHTHVQCAASCIMCWRYVRTSRGHADFFFFIALAWLLVGFRALAIVLGHARATALRTLHPKYVEWSVCNFCNAFRSGVLYMLHSRFTNHAFRTVNWIFPTLFWRLGAGVGMFSAAVRTPIIHVKYSAQNT